MGSILGTEGPGAPEQETHFPKVGKGTGGRAQGRPSGGNVGGDEPRGGSRCWGGRLARRKWAVAVGVSRLKPGTGRWL